MTLVAQPLNEPNDRRTEITHDDDHIFSMIERSPAGNSDRIILNKGDDYVEVSIVSYMPADDDDPEITSQADFSLDVAQAITLIARLTKFVADLAPLKS